MKAKAIAKTGHDLREQCGRLNLTAANDIDAVILAKLYRVLFVEGGEIAIQHKGESTTRVYRCENKEATPIVV